MSNLIQIVSELARRRDALQAAAHSLNAALLPLAQQPPSPPSAQLLLEAAQSASTAHEALAQSLQQRQQRLETLVQEIPVEMRKLHQLMSANEEAVGLEARRLEETSGRLLQEAEQLPERLQSQMDEHQQEIGRASCRERV